MALELNGTTGVSLVQDGVVTAADLASTLDLTGKTVTLPSGTGGKVLQVVQGTYGSQQGTTSTSFQATSITASITPSSASNKVLVISNFNGVNGSGSQSSFFTIYRDSTNLGSGSNSCFAVIYGNAGDGNLGMTYLDSPSTTSSVTYTVYQKTSSGGSSYITVQGTSTIVLMEIAA